MVDSGADASSLPFDVADALNVAYYPHPRVGFGAGGAFDEHEAVDDVVLVSEIGAIVLTRPSINAALPFVLLGRRDFFEGRRVCFDQHGQRIEIETD